MPMIKVTLPRAQRRRVQKHYQKTKSRIEAKRCRILLLLHEGHSVQTIAKLVNCVRSTIYTTYYRYEDYGEDAIYDRRQRQTPRKVDKKVYDYLEKYMAVTPREYGWLRTEWTLELLAKQLVQDTDTQLCKSHIRTLVREIGYRRTRACPVLRIPIRGRRKILENIDKIVKKSSHTAEVFYVDEADLHLNPKIGYAYCKRGEQRKIATPGRNHKCYIAGALNSRTGKITYTLREAKNSDLFIALLKELLKRYRSTKIIHIILDNYIIHKSAKVKTFLKQAGERISLHFLPPYSPNENKIERLWKQVHDNVTRNHQHTTLSKLVEEVQLFLDGAQPFPGTQASLLKMAA